MSILAKKTKTARKTQKMTLYWNQNSAKYHNVSKKGPVFTFSLPGGWIALSRHHWKSGLKTKYFWKRLKSASHFRLIDLILTMTVFLPVWNSHYTGVRFIVIFSCSDELAVHSFPLLCRQSWVAKVATDRSTVGLYCETICNKSSQFHFISR